MYVFTECVFVVCKNVPTTVHHYQKHFSMFFCFVNKIYLVYFVFPSKSSKFGELPASMCAWGMFSSWNLIFLSFCLFQGRAVELLCVCVVWLCADTGETVGLKQLWGPVSLVTGSDRVCVLMCVCLSYLIPLWLGGAQGWSSTEGHKSTSCSLSNMNKLTFHNNKTMQDRRCVCVFLPNDETLNVIVSVSITSCTQWHTPVVIALRLHWKHSFPYDFIKNVAITIIFILLHHIQRLFLIDNRLYTSFWVPRELL